MQKMIDSHFHIWRRADLPWLNGPVVPRIFGPYEPIQRDYPISEYRDDNADAGLGKAVYVQANWPKDRFEDEVAWVQAVADETGWPNAIVGYADLAVDDVRGQLDRLARYPLLRGVRMQLHWHEIEEFRFAPSPTQVVDDAVRRNVAHLKDYGLSFDLQLFPGQMRDGARLVSENPDTAFILTHAGMLIGDDARTRAAWLEGLHALAPLPNLHVKLSGLGTFVHRNDPALIRSIVDETVHIFGSRRLMFGSNFPIEKIWTTHAALMAAHRDAVAPHGPEAEADIFWNTAERVYRPA